MQLLLIKIGKAWNVLKRDGLFRGGKRVIKAFLGLFKGVQPGDILFISNGVGDSARYRTENVAEALRMRGFTASVTVQDNPFLVSYAHDFSVFIFHRVLFTEKVQKFIEHIKEHQKTIIFETDDLVYDPVFLKDMDYYAKMNTWEKKLYEHGLSGEILADPFVEVATTTTSFLADKLSEKRKKVFIVKNMLSKKDMTDAAAALQEVKKDPELVRIAYFSGTPSHNKDFATITLVLEKILASHPEVRLVLAGPLDTEDRLNQRFAEQIERVPFASRPEHFRNIAQVDINLAPLEIGNPFCESKSELKWFEAGIVGVPTVAAATRTFRDAITDGFDGYVAGTEMEWQEKLEKLITDKGFRIAMGEQARQTVLEKYTTESISDTDYSNYLKEKI